MLRALVSLNLHRALKILLKLIKSWIFPKISRIWKVLENEFGPGKFWNLEPMVHLSQYAFYV